MKLDAFGLMCSKQFWKLNSSNRNSKRSTYLVGITFFFLTHNTLQLHHRTEGSIHLLTDDRPARPEPVWLGTSAHRVSCRNYFLFTKLHLLTVSPGRGKHASTNVRLFHSFWLSCVKLCQVQDGSSPEWSQTASKQTAVTCHDCSPQRISPRLALKQACVWYST